MLIPTLLILTALSILTLARYGTPDVLAVTARWTLGLAGALAFFALFGLTGGDVPGEPYQGIQWSALLLLVPAALLALFSLLIAAIYWLRFNPSAGLERSKLRNTLLGSLLRIS